MEDRHSVAASPRGDNGILWGSMDTERRRAAGPSMTLAATAQPEGSRGLDITHGLSFDLLGGLNHRNAISTGFSIDLDHQK